MTTFERSVPETGWLIDFGSVLGDNGRCLGVSALGWLIAVYYTDERAIRFKRKQDAERMQSAFRYFLVNDRSIDEATVTEHQWG